MTKRLKCVVLAVGLCALLTGCEKVIDLTDEQNKLIAEYAAELLLRYDVNYVDRIDEGSATTEEVILQNEDTEASTTEAQTTEAVTEELTTEESNKGQEIDDTIEEDDMDADTTTNEVVGTEANIAKLIGESGVDISFKDYVLTDQYPARDEDGKFIYLEASQGYQLLVLRFRVVNASQEAMNVSLIDKEIDYRVVCNGNKAAKPMLTILMDDLATLETVVSPEQEQEAVLVFQVSNDMASHLEQIELKIHYNDVDNVIEILK